MKELFQSSTNSAMPLKVSRETWVLEVTRESLEGSETRVTQDYKVNRDQLVLWESREKRDCVVMLVCRVVMECTVCLVLWDKRVTEATMD